MLSFQNLFLEQTQESTVSKTAAVFCASGLQCWLLHDKETEKWKRTWSQTFYSFYYRAFGGQQINHTSLVLLQLVLLIVIGATVKQMWNEKQFPEKVHDSPGKLRKMSIRRLFMPRVDSTLPTSTRFLHLTVILNRLTCTSEVHNYRSETRLSK